MFDDWPKGGLCRSDCMRLRRCFTTTSETQQETDLSPNIPRSPLTPESKVRPAFAPSSIDRHQYLGTQVPEESDFKGGRGFFRSILVTNQKSLKKYKLKQRHNI